MTLESFARSSFLVAAASLGIALSASAAENPLKVTSFTAKAKVTSYADLSKPGLEYQAEYWVKDEKLRAEVTDEKAKVTLGTLMFDKQIYTWVFGEEIGHKFPVDSPEGQGSTNFADVRHCLENATAGGEETIDNVATRKYSYAKCGGVTGDVTIWIANGIGYVKKMQIKGVNQMVSVVFRNVESVEVSADRFLPPARIPFIGPQKPLPATLAPHPTAPPAPPPTPPPAPHKG